MAKLTIEVFSDAVCPWCWFGKRRLEKALALLGADAADVAVAWRPFQLNPDLPRGGMDRRAYRTAKFGSWERSLELEARVAEVGAGEGAAFDFARIARTPNTFDAHRLVWLAGREGAQPAAVEALFRAYFAEGRDIGRAEVLAELGAGAGLDRTAVERMLTSDIGSDEVRAEEARGRGLGLDGVPAFVIGGRAILVGAHEPPRLASAIRAALRPPAAQPPSTQEPDR